MVNYTLYPERHTVTTEYEMWELSEEREDFPITSLHGFLQEASTEFKRFRLQAKITLAGSLIVILLLSRFLIYDLMDLGPSPFETATPSLPAPRPDIPDLILLFASLAAVLFSVNVWMKQRKFIARWGERFEKLDALEKQLLPEETEKGS